jgi:hypothetical protein
LRCSSFESLNNIIDSLGCFTMEGGAKKRRGARGAKSVKSTDGEEISPETLYLGCIQDRSISAPTVEISSSNTIKQEEAVRFLLAKVNAKNDSNLQNFIEALPHNHPLQMGYFVPQKDAAIEKYSICPCLLILQPWREKHLIILPSTCPSTRIKSTTVAKMFTHLHLNGNPYHMV